MQTPVQELPLLDEAYRQALRQMMGPDTDEADLYRLLHLAQTYGLDPIRQELWLMRRKNSRGVLETSVITTRDGYLRYAQQHPEFEGLISFEVCEGDEFSIQAQDYTVQHRFGAQRGRVIGAWAKVDRKGKKPFISFASMGEYHQAESRTWKQYPSAMIRKVAEVMVLKRAFGITGLVTHEELESQRDTPPRETRSTVAPAEIQRPPVARTRKPRPVPLDVLQKANGEMQKCQSLEELKSFFRSQSAALREDRRFQLTSKMMANYLRDMEQPATGSQLEHIQTLLQDHLITTEERFRMESSLSRLTRKRAGEAVRRLEQALISRRKLETDRLAAEHRIRQSQHLTELETIAAQLAPELLHIPELALLLAETRSRLENLPSAA